MRERNLTMLLDFYELTMSNGFFQSGKKDEIAYFDLFFRTVPDGGGFVIAAGLDQIIEYIENLHFSHDDIEFLKSKKIFSDEFLDYLKAFRFSGDIYAVPEGTPMFPHEPILTVKAPIIQAQLIETFLLLSINHQSLIATKANRIVRAALGRAILEFGARRAQGGDGAILGARAAYIGGCKGTSCTLTDRLFGVPSSGTMAHSWVQSHESELEAFENYCRIYPNSTTLLVDTYDTLKSGVPNAIKAFKKVLLPLGIDNFAIRLDSGDIAYLSKQAREMLDEAGLFNCKITASNSLDEHIIRDLILQGAKIDNFGVGERLITSKSSPVFGGVYKLAAIEKDGKIIPKIKISDNSAKINNPHFKRVFRYYEKTSGKAIADELFVFDETPDFSKSRTLCDPDAEWKTKTVDNFVARELLTPVFIGGKKVYSSPDLQQIQSYCQSQIDTLWDEVTRFENPHNYYVDLSPELLKIKKSLLSSHKF